MSLKEKQAHLSELSQQAERKKRLDAMLEALRHEEFMLEYRASDLREALRKTEEEVSRLKNAGASTLFHALIGKKEARLDEKKAESAALKADYDEALRALADNRARIDALNEERSALKGAESACVQAEHEIKELLKEDPVYAEKLCLLERRLDESETQIRELREAVGTGNAFASQLDSVLETLKSAENWGKWDLFGGGIIADAAKYSKMDKAQKEMEDLERLAAHFRAELADVSLPKSPGPVTVEGPLRMADWMLDGLFFDWAVLSRIRRSREDLIQMSEETERILRLLGQMREEREQERRAVKMQITHLVTGGERPRGDSET